MISMWEVKVNYFEAVNICTSLNSGWGHKKLTKSHKTCFPSTWDHVKTQNLPHLATVCWTRLQNGSWIFFFFNNITDFNFNPTLLRRSQEKTPRVKNINWPYCFHGNAITYWTWGSFTRRILINLHAADHTTITSFLLINGFHPSIRCVWCLLG